MNNTEKNAEILALLGEDDLKKMMYVAFGLKMREIENGDNNNCNDKSHENQPVTICTR